jgi:hypothetical protein
MPSIAYYITAHGYGHGVRSCDILNALLRAAPQLDVQVVTGLPPDFLRNRIRGNVRIHNRCFDAGMVQLDSVRVDLPASLHAAQAMLSDRPARVAEEAAWLRSEGIGAVLADIPAMPLEASARVGIPSIAVGNFSWSWIYSEFADEPGWPDVIDAFAEGYRGTDLLLRLPFAEPMEIFPRRVDVPVLASPGKGDRQRLSALTGADPAKSWVLLSFTTLDWTADAVAEVSRLRDLEFFTILPLRWDAPNIHPVDRRAFPVPDLFATVDAVLTKPGYGVLSECIANGRPIVFVDRQHFRETPILVEAIRRTLRHAEISAENLYAGRLGTAIQQALSFPPPTETVPGGGAEICAGHILAHLGG